MLLTPVRCLVLIGWGGAMLGACMRSGFQGPPLVSTGDAATPIVVQDASAWVVDGQSSDQVVTPDALAPDSPLLDDGPAADSAGAADSGGADVRDAAVADARDAAVEDARDGAIEDVQDSAIEDAHDAATEDAHTGCGAGYHDGGDGSCVPAGTCSPAYHDGGDGSCLLEGECITSYHDGGDGVCMPAGTCVLGYHDGGDGRCVLDGSCSATFYDDGCGSCVSSGCCADHVEDPPGTCTLAPLAPPVLLDPPDSWPVATTTPTLRWSEVAGVGSVRYDLTLSSGPDCSGDVLDVRNLGEAWLDVDVSVGLVLGSTYHWCVRASDGVHPTSAWSPPSRLPLRGLRVRLRVGRPCPAPWFGERIPLLVDASAGSLVIPFGQVYWESHDLGYHWLFDLHRERWALGRGDGQAGTLQPDHVEDLAADPARGDVVAALGGGGSEAPKDRGLRFGSFDPSFRTWSELPVQVDDVDAGTLGDGGTAHSYTSGVTLAADPEADRTLVARSTWEPRETRVFALDRSTSPATLQRLGPASTLAAAPVTEVLHRIGTSDRFVHLFWDDASAPATALFDARGESWTTTSASTPQSSVLHAIPWLAAPLLVGDNRGECRIWNPATLQWDAWEAASSTAFHPPYGRAGLSWPAHAAYWTAAGDDVIHGVAGMVFEPDAWPVLTLLDASGSSADGTSARDVQVRIAGDDEAVAWLLSDDDSVPLSDDARWMPSPPTMTTIVGPAGLYRRALWLRYSNGSVGPVPGRASIWYLPEPPQAPTITIFGYSWTGALLLGLTETGNIAVALEAPLDGIVGFYASSSQQPPSLDQFGVGLVPVQHVWLPRSSGDVPVYAWVLDAAGQISQATTGSVFYRDIQPPSVQFGAATAYSVITAVSPQITWTASDISLPVTVDLRISTAADDCSGDVLAVDGLAGNSYGFDPDVLLPGQLYTACIRGHDAWSPPNTSGWVQTRFFFQRTSARWHALARLPTDIGYGSAITYDTHRSRILMFGGFYAGNYRAGVHAYDSVANSWSLLATVPSPEPRGRGGAMALYDEPRDRLVITGGFYNQGTQQYPQDTWALDLATLTWAQLSTTGAAPRRTFAATLDDEVRDRWLVGHYTIWTGDTVHDPMLFDLASSTWSTLPAFTGYSWGTGNLLPAFATTGPLVVPQTALHDLDLASVTTTTRVSLSGSSSYSEMAAAWDDATGQIVQYPLSIGSTASQTQRTYLVDAQSGLRLRSDAANIPDRGFFGLIRDPVRRSVVMVGGYTQHGNPFVQTSDVNEFRHHGGPRVFAADPGTGSESTFAGDTVNLAVDWDEGATAWLVNEVAWPPPAPTDPAWVGVRPTAYTFADSSPGPRSVFVWIKDAGGGVVQDPGHWDLTCTGP